jgi:CO dehydrogenase maturation factor
VCGTCGTHGEAGGIVDDRGSRIVVVGKGGVGKSTLTALIARIAARDGVHVLAVDADEQRNLGATLGVGYEELAACTPVASQADYIEEKTGARPGEGAGGMLRLNPDTSDLVDRLSLTGPDGVRLLVMGGVQQAGGGCLCPEHALLSAAVAGMRLREDQVVVMDTHAGVEHFGRALARGFDTALVVVEPAFNATQVGWDTARLARELGIGDIHLVVNRSRSPRDTDDVLGMVDRFGGFDFAHTWSLPFDGSAPTTDPSVDGLLAGSELADAVSDLVRHLRDPAPGHTHPQPVGAVRG